jgi:hypothetical protein
MKHTSGDLSEVSTIYLIIYFQENFSQPGLANRIVLQVKLIKPMEGILVGVHVERID